MSNEFYKIRRITGERYDIFDKQYIRIMNMSQAAHYMAHDVELFDCYPGTDKYTGKPVVVFVFRREDTKEAYDLWCRQKEEKVD